MRAGRPEDIVIERCSRIGCAFARIGYAHADGLISYPHVRSIRVMVSYPMKSWV